MKRLLFCCAIFLAALAILRHWDAEDDDPSTASTSDAFDLGMAIHPDGTLSRDPAMHGWRAKHLDPTAYKVGYVLAPTESAALDASLRAYAKKVEYEESGPNKFKWVPPKGCSGDTHCIFEDLAVRNRADLEPLVERFRIRAKEAHLSTLDLAALVVTFTQAIKYEVPASYPFGVLPPALVVSQRKGDCDSKSFMALMILHALGIDAMLVESNAHTHTMLGIALPVQGTKFTYQGRDYAFTEMTARSSPIGHINEDLLTPNDWKPLFVRLPDG